MPRDWQELTHMTQGVSLIVERVRLVDSDIAIEGSFELPRLASLSSEDQMFVAAFIRSHGSIKQMEQLFSVSYPTIKTRLNRIGKLLDQFDDSKFIANDDVLSRLDRGEISVEEALDRLRK